MSSSKRASVLLVEKLEPIEKERTKTPHVELIRKHEGISNNRTLSTFAKKNLDQGTEKEDHESYIERLKSRFSISQTVTQIEETTKQSIIMVAEETRKSQMQVREPLAN